jgi:mRNA interferase YafQ
MYSIDYTHQFKKDLRKCAKRGLDIEEIKTAIKILSESGTLPKEYLPHPLKGDRKGQWECHIQHKYKHLNKKHS